MGAPKRKTAAYPTNSESFAIWWISQAGGFGNGQPPLHFLTALNRACHSDRAAATKGFSQLIERFHLLTGILRIRSVHGNIPAVAGVCDHWANNPMLIATRSGGKTL
jgi:hypothetical protein